MSHRAPATFRRLRVSTTDALGNEVVIFTTDAPAREPERLNAYGAALACLEVGSGAREADLGFPPVLYEVVPREGRS